MVNAVPAKFDESFVTNTLMSEVENLLLNHLSGAENLDVTKKEPEPFLSEKGKKNLQYLVSFYINFIPNWE